MAVVAEEEEEACGWGADAILRRMHVGFIACALYETKLPNNTRALCVSCFVEYTHHHQHTHAHTQGTDLSRAMLHSSTDIARPCACVCILPNSKKANSTHALVG